MTRLYLVRHGETEWNRERRVQGQADPPLNDTGRAQARALAERLAGVRFDAAYASDLRRSLETATILLDGRGLALTPVAGLRERFFGPWEGRLVEEIQEQEPEAWALWLQHRPDEAPPGVETRAAFEGRVGTTLRSLVAAHPTDTILVVSHGGTIWAALTTFCGLASSVVANCGGYVLAVERGEWRLLDEV